MVYDKTRSEGSHPSSVYGIYRQTNNQGDKNQCMMVADKAQCTRVAVIETLIEQEWNEFVKGKETE
uniref:Uncharacterized protein n=1 Tax=viral metagenome TaxID=1070528 RepID=A0A6M3LA04_9ZZZZ